MTSKPVVNGYWQVSTGVGKKMDASEVVVSPDTVERERMTLSDPVAPSSHARSQDFLSGLEIGITLQGIYDKKLLDQINLLTQEVKAMRISFEGAMV